MSYQNGPYSNESGQIPSEQMPEAPKMNFQGYENLGFVMPIRKN